LLTSYVTYTTVLITWQICTCNGGDKNSYNILVGELEENKPHRHLHVNGRILKWALKNIK
jgi:hypothetical protein